MKIDIILILTFILLIIITIVILLFIILKKCQDKRIINRIKKHTANK